MSDKLLEDVQNFAYVYLSIKEIAQVTGADIDELKDEQSDIGKAFIKGRLLRKAEYNKSVITLSKQLSSPAMAIEAKIAEQVYLNDQKP